MAFDGGFGFLAYEGKGTFVAGDDSGYAAGSFGWRFGGDSLYGCCPDVIGWRLEWCDAHVGIPSGCPERGVVERFGSQCSFGWRFFLLHDPFRFQGGQSVVRATRTFQSRLVLVVCWHDYLVIGILGRCLVLSRFCLLVYCFGDLFFGDSLLLGKLSVGFSSARE